MSYKMLYFNDLQNCEGVLFEDFFRKFRNYTPKNIAARLTTTSRNGHYPPRHGVIYIYTHTTHNTTKK